LMHHYQSLARAPTIIAAQKLFRRAEQCRLSSCVATAFLLSLSATYSARRSEPEADQRQAARRVGMPVY
jgi:hypothetical protein